MNKYEVMTNDKPRGGFFVVDMIKSFKQQDNGLSSFEQHSLCHCQNREHADMICQSLNGSDGKASVSGASRIMISTDGVNFTDL